MSWLSDDVVSGFSILIDRLYVFLYYDNNNYHVLPIVYLTDSDSGGEG